MERKTLLENVMKAIRERRLANKWSQGKLADLCGWENAAGRISNYENLTREPTLSDLDKMAEAVGSNLHALLVSDYTPEKNDNYSGYMQLPLLKMDEISHWLEGNITHRDRSVKMYIAAINVGKKLLAVTVEGDAMESPGNIKKSICDGDIIAVSLDAIPVQYDIVVVRIGDEAKIREYTKDGTEIILKAFNPAYPPMKFDNHHTKLIGVVVNKTVNYREP